MGAVADDGAGAGVDTSMGIVLHIVLSQIVITAADGVAVKRHDGVVAVHQRTVDVLEHTVQILRIAGGAVSVLLGQAELDAVHIQQIGIDAVGIALGHGLLPGTVHLGLVHDLLQHCHLLGSHMILFCAAEQVDTGAALEVVMGITGAGVDLIAAQGCLCQQRHAAVVGVDKSRLGSLVQAGAAASAGNTGLRQALAGLQQAVIGKVHGVVIGAGHGVEAHLLQILHHIGLGEDVTAAAEGIGKAGIIDNGSLQIGEADVASLQEVTYFLEFRGVGQMVADHRIACGNKRNHIFLLLFIRYSCLPVYSSGQARGFTRNAPLRCRLPDSRFRRRPPSWSP